MFRTRLTRKGKLSIKDLREVWHLFSAEERIEGFHLLDRGGAEEFFLSLKPAEKAQLLLDSPESEERTWLRFLPPDDVADVIQHVPADERDRLLLLIDEPTRKQVTALLAYAEDQAGGLMNPLFIRMRPEMTVEEAIIYFRKQMLENSVTIHYAYVLDSEQRLLGVVPWRRLLSAPSDTKMKEIMREDSITVSDKANEEEVSRLFEQHKLLAIPVVNDQGIMQGIVTLDDIMKVVEKEATEDFQKIGGVEAFDEPYLQIGFFKMLKKRAGWLTVLFIGEMLTATAMGYFENEIAKAVVLALFIPLIISSGGNCGSQASTLVIRALALREVRFSDWWRVFTRESAMGLALGGMLAVIGFFRILFWPNRETLYGEHYVLIGLTVAGSLVGIVMWGTLMGSLFPLLLKRMGFDPASASAPFVATMVDVTGIIIYFSVASLILGGVLL